MSGRYLLGLDAGGGGGRCLLVDVESARIVRAVRRWVHPTAPGTGGMGTDLALEPIWAELGVAVREAMARAGAAPEQVLGIAVTGMRFATVVLDRDGRALLALPNRDGRAVGAGLELAAEHGAALHARTGNWPSPVSVASRLRWLAAERPAEFERAASVLTLSDWVAYRLCGERATDPSHAGDSVLYDVAQRGWAADVADALGIRRSILPPVLEAGSRLGSLGADAARHLGLRAGTPVAVGGGDSHCGLLGAGAVAPGQMAATLGTSTPVQLALDRPVIDPQGRLWTGCHVVPGTWVLESNAGLTGEVLEWFAGLLYPDTPQPTAMLLAEAARSAPGAAGALSTLGAQVMNARELRFPTGTLTLSHLTAMNDPGRRAHLARAVVEGLAYAVRANVEQLLATSGASVAALRIGGGMSQSALVAQLLSDVLDLRVEASPTPDTTALGAALCAGVGAGVFADLPEAAGALARSARVFTADPERARRYGELYGTWLRLRGAQVEAEAVATEVLLPAALDAAGRNEVANAVTMRPRMLVTADMDDDALAALRELGDVEYASFRNVMRLLAGRTLVEALQGVHVFVTEVDVVDAAVLHASPDLRVVVACRGDAVNVDVAACTAFGVPVLNAPGRNADAVADLTVAFLLMLARKLPQATAFLHQPGGEAGDVGRMGQAFTSLQGRELWRKTVGLVGVGAVGRGVARRLAGFGARIVAYDPHVPAEQVTLAGAESVSLDELLAQSDFVSLHAAAPGDGRCLLGPAELAAMKPGACLVNTARAALVDEAALVEALRRGRLGGAAVDVFGVEPPAADHPLLAIDTVIATPHVGGNTSDVAAHQGRLVAEDLCRLLRGERPRHPRNPEALAEFSWDRPRPVPDRATLARLAARPAPAVSDLQRDRAAHVPRPSTRPQAIGASAEANGGAVAAVGGAMSPEGGARLERIAARFVERLGSDAAIRAAAAGRQVSLGFTLSDVGLAFHLALHDGAVSAAMGAPSTPPDVELKMPAAVFDGMFTGTVNPMEAALSGRLSFTGDTVKAMAIQELQADLSRLYGAAREEIGDPGDLAPGQVNGAEGRVIAPVGAGDVRQDVVQIVNELYASELITATGGNVSVRVPGAAGELWITPSQLFKGQLRPEMLVRIDLDGRPLDDSTLPPSSERLMHCAVYRARSDATAVIHAHAPHATILANAGLPFLPISTEAAFFGDIPRVPFIMPGTEELARAIGEAMGGAWAVLMRNHGLLVAGRTLRRAADMVEIIDRSAEVILGCYAVGKEPPTLPAEVVTQLQQLGDLLA